MQTRPNSRDTLARPSVNLFSDDLFGLLRDRIVTQRRISYADYQEMRSAHKLMADPAASVVWRLIQTYERHKMHTLPLHAVEIEAIAESWANVLDQPRRT